MASISINSVTYNDFNTAFGAANGFPSTGNYYALPPFGKPPAVSVARRDYRQITFPGVNYIATKDFGIRERMIHVELIAVAASATAAESARDTLANALSAVARYTIAIKGVSYAGCKLAPGGAMTVGQFCIGGQVCMLLSCDFLQLSNSN